MFMPSCHDAKMMTSVPKQTKDAIMTRDRFSLLSHEFSIYGTKAFYFPD